MRHTNGVGPHAVRPYDPGLVRAGWRHRGSSPSLCSGSERQIRAVFVDGFIHHPGVRVRTRPSALTLLSPGGGVRNSKRFGRSAFGKKQEVGVRERGFSSPRLSSASPLLSSILLCSSLKGDMSADSLGQARGQVLHSHTGAKQWRQEPFQPPQVGGQHDHPENPGQLGHTPHYTEHMF